MYSVSLPFLLCACLPGVWLSFLCLNVTESFFPPWLAIQNQECIEKVHFENSCGPLWSCCQNSFFFCHFTSEVVDYLSEYIWQLFAMFNRAERLLWISYLKICLYEVFVNPWKPLDISVWLFLSSWIHSLMQDWCCEIYP